MTWDLAFKIGGAALGLLFVYLDRKKLAVSTDQKRALRQQVLIELGKTVWQSVEAMKASGDVSTGLDAEATFLGQLADHLAKSGAAPLDPDEVAGMSSWAKMQSQAGKYMASLKNGHADHKAPPGAEGK